MLISIITPTFNSAGTIGRNAESVLRQTYKNFEHIIIDNLSTDGTVEIIKKNYSGKGFEDKLKITSEKDEGISDAFNKGIKEAKGEIVAILNSDDCYYSDDIFQKVADAFNDPGILFVHGDIFFDDQVHGSNIRRPLQCPVTVAMPYNHPSMFFRREVYEKYGVYDTSFKYAMDYEFIIRCSRLIQGFDAKGKYLAGEPVAKMYAGGASWENELKSLEENKCALKQHGFWNFDAFKNYLYRKLRTILKNLFTKLNLTGIIHLWRKRKWGN